MSKEFTPTHGSAFARFAALWTTPFVPDDYIRLVNPLWTAETLHARVRSIQPEAAGAVTLTLQPGVRWNGHRAGQYLRFSTAIDGVRHTRCYSISSAPERSDGLLTLTVKPVESGRMSNHVAAGLSAGALVEISQAEGDFTMPYVVNEGVLMIAAGSGITPVMSLLRSAAARTAMPDTTLLYYTPSPEETIFRDELLRLSAEHPSLRVHFIHTRAPSSDGDLQGHFSAAHLSRVCADWKQRRTWACGPAALLEALETQWAVQGRSEQLTTERFRPAQRTVADETAGGHLTFTASARQAEREGSESILETAERAGLAPEHGCRMGICHGCTARLVCGTVRDLRDGRIQNEENDLIQICVCAPVGAVQIAL
jgi:ferredoxin-NADP reductase